jgi:hypothetical protein
MGHRLTELTQRTATPRTTFRVVVLAINTMLSDWGEEIFYRVANAYRGRTKNAHPIPNLNLRIPTQKIEQEMSMT